MAEPSRFGDRLARLKTQPAPIEDDLSRLPDLTLEALPGSLERLRPWIMAETPYGRAHVYRERLPVADCLAGSFVAPGPLCPHSIDAILGDTRLEGFRPEDALYLDIEATGLSHGAGTSAFLIGCAWFEGREVVMEQILMADPSTEMAVLERCRQLLASRRFLVSFNGKSYDLSVLESRLVITGLLTRTEASLKLQPHLDLLHVSRQAYKGVFEDTRLQTLERRVLRLDPAVRADDIPGSLVPALYFHYLRTGYAPHLDGVLKHNRTDVLSMVALAEHLISLLTRPSGNAFVLSNLGRSALRRALPARAARLFTEALATAELGSVDEQRTLEDLVRAARRAKNLPLLAFARERLGAYR